MYSFLRSEVAATPLQRHSGSKWGSEDLDNLMVTFEEVTSVAEFRGKIAEPSQSLSQLATVLIKTLEAMPSHLSPAFNEAFKERNKPESLVLQHPLVKATYFVEKYSNQEAAVDAFMQLLLSHLGYNDDWMFAFPQFDLSLSYGNVAGSFKAKADFTVMDVLSFYRMAVVEDKRLQDRVLNCEPQLVAEAIAEAQANINVSKKRKAEDDDHSSESAATLGSTNAEDPIYGVRLNGLAFYFYVIPVSKAILEAMSQSVRATRGTKVFRSQRLDWDKVEDRKDIITILDTIRGKLAVSGGTSARRDSFGQSGATSSAV
jgi:hypothetical protein